MSAKLLLQDFYFWCFNEHLFSTIGALRPGAASALTRLYYRQRPWKEYPLFPCADERSLLLIHIPKCGGTSIAKALGRNQIRHLPASVFHFSDPARFQALRTCAIVRHPYERMASTLSHFRSVGTDRDKGLSDRLGLSETDAPRHIADLFGKRGIYRDLFMRSNAGRAGFSASQCDYLCHRNKLLVHNLFTLDRLDEFAGWLSQQLGKPVEIGHHNKSNRNSAPPAAIDDARIASTYALDFRLYDLLKSQGGVALEGSPEIAAISELVESHGQPEPSVHANGAETPATG